MPCHRPAEIENWVRVNCPKTMTLVLTNHDCDTYLAEMIEAGVSGYLDARKTGERLIDAIQRVAHGET